MSSAAIGLSGMLTFASTALAFNGAADFVFS